MHVSQNDNYCRIAAGHDRKTIKCPCKTSPLRRKRRSCGAADELAYSAVINIDLNQLPKQLLSGEKYF
ncbi:hypothetical protein ATZ36_13390 [Candidatus Endomicrobiellum trichonymphae]|uniref:Uncharacterized protein n=1 Tax=Endomicrobium trichonymphae TaxID=1408204 RepID=A0A1E5IMK4_ENDTX|nr:hypothetical protein ATZ36_13390 [Candidatus Endomicrobium trichonymphae]